jgi:hypothetical protein
MKPKFYLLAFILFTGFLFGQTDVYAQTKTAKYVFYFIGDGMGVNQVNGTKCILRTRRKNWNKASCFYTIPFQYICYYLLCI